MSVATNRRIALYLPSLRGGGAERVMVNLARGFIEEGIQVDLVLARAEGSYLSQVPRSLRILDLHATRVLASLFPLVRYLRRERPVAIVSALDHANLVTIWARILAGVQTRVVVTVHSTLSRAVANATTVRERWIPHLIQKFYPWADEVIAVSRGVAEDLSRLSGLHMDRISVIYNPVVTPELLVQAEQPLKHPWFSLGEPPVILGVGRLTPAKDYSTLIQAFSLVRKFQSARLMILGEGEERPRLESLVRELGIEQDVALPGFVENPYQYMRRAAVFVLSSKWEGFGNVLVEAMAAGTPVVSTNCPSGPSEILEGGRWGTLVPVGDVEALSRAILTAFNEKWGVGKERAQLFRLEEVVQQYASVIGVAKGD